MCQANSVADPRCLSRIQTTTTKKSIRKFNKIEDYLIFFEQAQSQLTTKLRTNSELVIKHSEVWVGSEIRSPEKTYPRSRFRIQGVKQDRIPDPDPQQSSQLKNLMLTFDLESSWWQAKVKIMCAAGGRVPADVGGAPPLPERGGGVAPGRVPQAPRPRPQEHHSQNNFKSSPGCCGSADPQNWFSDC